MEPSGEDRGDGRLSRRRVLQLGAVGVVVLPSVLAACGSDNSSGGSATTARGTGTTAGGASATSATPTSTTVPADRTAILRFGAMRGTSYDPIKVGTQTEYPQLNVLFDTLITTDPLTGELKPRLATKWDVQPDRVRLTLRQGVTFQDGTPFNADAVKFSIERALSDPDSNIKTRIPMVSGVTVVDPQTADIMLNANAPASLLVQLSDRPGMMVSPTAVQAAGNSANFSKKPVGAGMYAISGDWFPREKMSVRAWPGYWDKDAALLGGIDFTEVAMAAQLNALRAGEEDMGSYLGTDVATIKGQEHLRTKIGYSAVVKGLVMNWATPPFDNLKVRQAISYAIDRNAAVQALSAGYGRAAWQMFAKESPAYDPALDNMWPYNPDKAKQLLAEAGFPNGVDFKSIIGSSSAPYVQFGQLIQGQLKKVGINMDLQLVDAAQTLALLYQQGAAPSSPLATGGSVPDISMRQTLLKEGQTNAAHQDVPGVRDLLDKASAATSQAEANGYYKQVSKIVTEGLYSIIPVFNDPAVSGYYDYVGGITRGMADTDTSPEMFRGIYITQGKTPASQE
ncbi:MAG TPA: ABC transporter substrate-binding protein [Acidimicrobiales bacterium]|nr:ABC transporter substrate-binding protein [Acidimicrobiales bacterium]